MKRYTRNFYRQQRERSRSSARAIVPLVMDLVRPASVVDLGCGSGAWLSVFQENGVEDLHGMDGDWVDPDLLFIPARQFSRVDLKKPIPVERHFDLALSLEVAEHLPAHLAPAFVDSLAALSPVVLFSAAIPGQGGTHHVNEQWPEYWAELFREQGFAVIDCIRKTVWQNQAVEWWYAQNLLLFVREDQLEHYPLLRRELNRTASSQLSLVHPKQYLAARDPSCLELTSVLSALPGLIAEKARGLIRSCLGRCREDHG